LGVGGIVALSLSRGLTSLLYEVAPNDPITLLTVLALVVLTGLLACYFPARRAAQTEPLCALRHES